MNAVQENAQVEPAAPSAPTAPGAVLAQERVRLGMSVGDVAAKLRMSVVQIEALERADYARLPTGTFLRGFVRSYAKLIGLEPEPMLRLLESTHAGGRRPNIVVPSQNIKIAAPTEGIASPRGRWTLIGLLVLALLGGFAYWFLYFQPERGGTTSKAARAPAVAVNGINIPVNVPAPSSGSPSNAVTASATPDKSDAVQTAAPAAVASEPAATTPAAKPAAKPSDSTASTAARPERVQEPAAPAKPARPTVPAGSGSLRFSFTGDSWVEVIEVTGKTLVSRRYKSGEDEQLVARLPATVVIGNATLTRLVFNDVEFDLTPHTRVAVARFTLK